MKTVKINHQIRLAVAGCLAAAFCLLAGGCGKSDIKPYESKDKLWFTQVDNEGVSVVNIVRSFFLYPGSQTLDAQFEIVLIGAISDQDRPYKVVVVDEETTALPSEYEVLPTVFRAGREKDMLTVRLIKSARMDTEEVKLTLNLVENELFELGYTGRLSATINFNNITIQPKWWTTEISNTYFGPYSKEKFEAYYAFTGRNDIEGLAPSELLELLLGLQEYINKNKLKEADGSPIIILIAS